MILEKFQTVTEDIRTRTMKENDKGNLNQNDRNTVKHDLIEAIMSDLPSAMVVGRASEGIVVEVPHEHFGSITLVIDAKVKNMDWDGQASIDEFALKQEKAKERAEKRKRDTAESIRQSEARKKKTSK